jgi:zinc and cadmium transporter
MVEDGEMSTVAFIPVFAASGLACIVTTIGIYVIGRYERWASANNVYFMSFAAGVLISVSFVHILPKSFGMHDAAPLYLLSGFMGLYLINRFLTSFVCEQFDRPDLAAGITPMLGIGFHSFIDGVIYTITFKVSIFTGVLAAAGMVLHEFPEGIVTFLLMERGGFNTRTSALCAFLAAGLSTPLGTLISYPFVQAIGEGTLGALLALSAGALIYVGASHLLPAVERQNQRYTIVSLFTGVVVAAIIVLSER